MTRRTPQLKQKFGAAIDKVMELNKCKYEKNSIVSFFTQSSMIYQTIQKDKDHVDVTLIGYCTVTVTQCNELR